MTVLASNTSYNQLACVVACAIKTLTVYPQAKEIKMDINVLHLTIELRFVSHHLKY